MANLGTGAMAAIGILGLFILVCFWRVFTKCGEPGWSCLIPIYNYYVWAKMVKRPELFKWMLYSLGAIILGAIFMTFLAALGWILIGAGYIALIVVAIMMYHALSVAFGQGAGFTIGLLFLGIIFFPLLAFGNYTYQLDNKPSGNEAILDA